MRMADEDKYWFPAKRYGWGWGMPATWQGWTVMGVFVALLVAGGFVFPPSADIGAFITYVSALCAVLVGVCWLKGEPPRWRWGKR
jgi:hypothetical protein